ncbi:sensor histidine kinase [Amycolatopsis sp. Poz14]|uniref:sensor histidine kinase n=1 Tax=Amycolatopsis sp. Poz14 TaxID=1447705 RepID=UPI001F868210|nr:two-component sensor histidine kinase [Amycolatopsis sp. Poz14]
MRSALPRPRELPPWQQNGLVALAVFAGGTMLYLTGGHQLLPNGDPFPLWVRFAELGAMCLAAFLRRTVPWGLLAATGIVGVDVALGLSLPIVIAYTDFLYSAMLHGSRWTTRVLVGVTATVTLTVLFVFLAVAGWRAAALGAFSMLSFLLVPVWWGANVRQQSDIAASERANAEQLATIAALDRRAAVAAERARMARDLHDVVAGHLSAIAIQSEAALSMADDPKTAQTVLVAVRENSVRALEEMRAMIGLLRSESAEDEVTAPARLAELARLVESARAAGMTVAVDSTVDEELPTAVDLTAYRIAQESLTNAVKHAPGGRVTVRLRVADSTLTVEIGNELLGAPTPSDSGGHGLLSMRERAHAVGGTLRAGPSGPRWLVHAELPLAGEPS